MTTPVPKPPSAGAGQTAIANTRAGYANVRTGPGTQYTDIGDIVNGTQVTYYPQSNSSDWVWVEQSNVAGWVFSGVVTFEAVQPYEPPDFSPTPYDGAVAVWHWKGQAVPETTIEQLAQNLRRNAPNVTQVWVKVTDGNSWQGRYDSGDMAINGPDDIDRWVGTLQRYDLEFHAWSVVKGVDVDGEANVIVQAVQRPGVQSLILDVEPFEGYWQVGPEPVRPLMTTLRRSLDNRFHIGMAVDPRSTHYDRIHPEEWQPFVNSVHPMCYWKTFRRDVGEVLEEAYRVWGDYGLPIIPILQGDATVEEQREAHSIATRRFWATGVSWWRYGVIAQWGSVNLPIDTEVERPTDPTEKPPPGTQYGRTVIIFAGQDGYRSGTYTGREELVQFRGAFDWDAFYTTTELRISKVWAEWRTDITESGIYQISVFIPARHSTTRRARYKIHGIRGTNTEVIVDLNQAVHRNEWVPLGIFDLVRGQTNAGKVFLNDVTGESGKEIAFDAVRVRQIIILPTDPTPDPEQPDIIDGVPVSDGFDSPVGTEEERRGPILWPAGWRDASPYGELYFEGTSREAYHTGADLNWGAAGNTDLGMPVYSPANGEVVFAARINIWGNVMVIRHDPLKRPDGPVFYTRYGHVQNMLVEAGDRVKRGDQIAEIGNGFGRFIAHLHFDISPTTRLEVNPADWPGKDRTRILRDYIDPLVFIRNNRP